MIGRGSLTRLRVVAFLCLVPFALVTARLIWLQVVKADAMTGRAESQHMRRVWNPPHRGEITDRYGDPLARTIFNTSIVAEPEKVENPARTARVLAQALHTSPRRLEKLLRSSRKEVYLERRVTPFLDRRLNLEDLPGIREEIELKRVYPLGEAMAHVVGCLDHAAQGSAGIEKEYDWLLRGHPGWSTELRDAHGGSYVALGRRHKPAISGHTIVLTLDANLQDVAYSELARAAQSLNAKGGALVAVDPRTGEILALASWPSFDPERANEAAADALRNRAVVDPYEPGSTFKIVTATTALAGRIMTPSTLIDCEGGSHDFGGFRIRDHHPHGVLPFQRAFAVSSNIAFAKVGIRCGPQLYQTARAFGFGSASGVELPGESAGMVRRPEQWSRSTPATLAIGYEVLATPLQIAMAYAAVANNGVLLRPQLIKAMVDPAGKLVFRSRPETVRRVMTVETARTLRGFLREVMTEGTGKEADLSWVEVGGKTGTTEKLVDGVYSTSRHYASFVGMAPLENPRVVCLVMLDEPQKETFGGSAAAPVFREMLEAAGRLPGAWLGPEYATVVVEPDPAKSAFWAPPPVLARPATHAAGGPGGDGEGMPDFRGVSLRQALRTLRAYGLHAEIEGTGIVADQDPPPGSALADTLRLVCSRETAGALVLAELQEKAKPGHEEAPAGKMEHAARVRRATRP